MKPIDFSNIHVMLCCFGNERVSDLYAAAFNILMNAQDVRMTIAFNEPELTEESHMRFELLTSLAEHTDNHLTWRNFPSEFSKAKMIGEVLLQDTQFAREWYLNVDDDYMIPYRTLDLIAQASAVNKPEVKTYVYGQFDIINYRNYEDWNATPLRTEDLFNFARENGIRCLPNHLIADVPDGVVTYNMPGQSTGAYMMRRRCIDREMLLQLKDWPKGKRGYDEYLCNAVGGVAWLYGSNSFHTDRTKAHVDGKVWHTDVFRDDLMMDGSVKGRQPSKLGEQSIARAEKPADAPEIPSHSQLKD